MTNKPTITLDFITPAHLYWFDIERGEPIESATDETLSRAGYVPAASLAAAVGNVRDLEGQLQAIRLDNDRADRDEREARAGYAAGIDRARADVTMARSKTREMAERLTAAESRHEQALAQCARVEQQNATLREMVTEVDCLRENAVTLRRSAEHWEQRATAAERVVEAAQRMQRYNRSDPLNAALDALAPDAPDGKPVLSYETRRLPVVQPARTCAVCTKFWSSKTCPVDVSGSSPACPAFVGKEGAE